MDEIVDLSPYVVKTDEHCVGSGGFGDVYKGVRLDRPSASERERRVAIKVIRPSMTHIDSLPKAIKQLKREMAVWQGLNHTNVVPFLGVSYTFGRMPALISLWMENGRLDGYLLAHPDADRGRITEGLASGLRFLHSRVPKITHGDVKAANTLVDWLGNPRLCDFGLSRMLSDDSLWMTTTVNLHGSIRWMAPELLDGTEPFPTSESDVYAFAMTVLEILTGKIPYHNHRMDGAVLMAVTIRKEFPIRPTEMDSSVWQMDLDELWKCLTECWNRDPGRRPSMAAAEELFRLGKEKRVLSSVNVPVAIHRKLFKGHTNWVLAVTFSHDGKQIASGSEDNTLRVWNAETGEVISRPFVGHVGAVNSVAFSPDDKRIVSGSEDNTVRVWDADAGEVVSAPFKRHRGAIQSVAFSPDGKRIASGSRDRTVRVWDPEVGKVIWVADGHAMSVSSVAFSPDDKWIASGSLDSTVRLWDAETGEAISKPFEGHRKGILSVAISPDGKRIASASHDRTVRLWNAETGEMVSKPFEGHTDSVASLSFSPCGKWIVSGSWDKTVRVWDTATGEVLLPLFEGHTEWVMSVAFSPDGRRIALGSVDSTVRVWNAETDQKVQADGHT